MPTTSRCESCGWEGPKPVPLEEVAGERLVWRVCLCPQCMAEVTAVEDSEPPSPR